MGNLVFSSAERPGSWAGAAEIPIVRDTGVPDGQAARPTERRKILGGSTTHNSSNGCRLHLKFRPRQSPRRRICRKQSRPRRFFLLGKRLRPVEFLRCAIIIGYRCVCGFFLVIIIYCCSLMIWNKIPANVKLPSDVDLNLISLAGHSLTQSVYLFT